jgi:uncharacterized protein YggE
MTDSQTLFLRPPVWALITAVALGGIFYIAGKHIESKPNLDPPVISVDGEGKVMASPDIAALMVGVQSVQKTAKQAMAELATKMSMVIDAMEKAGVAEKDLVTESLSLQPMYDWTSGRQTLTGYQAMQNLRAKIRDLDNVSNVLDAAVSQGANQVGGVNLTIDDPEKLRAEARMKAIATAKEKASMLASQLGVSLGKLRGFSEGGGPAMPYARMMMESKDMGVGGGGMAPPIPAGEQEVVVSVSLMYELK